MSEYLRSIRGLLVALGGVASPEIFPVDDILKTQMETPSKMELKKGKKVFTPMEFSFFQGVLSRAYIIGHIYETEQTSIPVVFAINASVILWRYNGELKPYVHPIIRETVILPDKLKGKDDTIRTFQDAGIDIERYPISTNSYKGIQESAAMKTRDILAEVKQDLFLLFANALEDKSQMILVDGSLRPIDAVVSHGNWVGLHLNPIFSAGEEKESLLLAENQVSEPFKLTKNGRGFFWHLRMLSDMRKGPEYGLIKVDNVLNDGDDMQSKMQSISTGILAERFPIHPASNTEGWGLYPLITARIFLRTQTTNEKIIMKYF